MDKFSYPEYYFGDRSFTLADQDGIYKPNALVMEHANSVRFEDKGKLQYTINSSQYSVHWDDGQALVETPNQTGYIMNRSRIVTRNGGNPATEMREFQSRYTRVSLLRIPEISSVEQRILESMMDYEYEAVEAWRIDSTEKVLYRSKNNQSEIIINSDGIIEKFTTHGDTDIDYRLDIDESAPPLFKPTWLVQSNTEES